MIDTTQISQICPIPEAMQEDLRTDLAQAAIPWREAYSDYQSGGWFVAPLTNSQGSSDQIKLDGGEPVPTPLLEQFPSVERFMTESELDFRLVRLARIEPGAFMHEHNDNVGIAEDRLRLHIPITTNPDAVLNFDHSNVHLGEGFAWKLDHERVAHAASNFGEESRVHLILDCRMNEALRELVGQEKLDPQFIIAKPLLGREERSQLVEEARELIRNGDRRAGEEKLLITFATRDLGEGSSYDLLLEAYETMPHERERYDFWVERLLEVRGRESRL
jgi:hypothetical protein